MNLPAKAPLLPLLLLIFSATAQLQSKDEFPTREETLEALRSSVAFFRKHAGYQGAYVYRCASDLSLREGERKALATTGWTQPPGTPTIGSAYLDAYRITGEDFLKEAAFEVAKALHRSQLESGGWTSSFELGEGRARYRYRLDPDRPKASNYTSLDDQKTQASLLFLLYLDETLPHEEAFLRECIDYAMEKLLTAQYANGAWPQQFKGPATAEGHQPKSARYPEKWSREYQKADYRHYYTFNDNAMADMMTVMLRAWQVYQRQDYLHSACKTGNFFLLAQMPDPQPGWAQQYNQDMEPAWARKFEPPAITGGESRSIMKALIQLYRHTRDEKYLEPIPRALAYYTKSLLPAERLARFYELHSNKPLYFTKSYQLTYEDSDLPTHYGFTVRSNLEAISKEYEQVKSLAQDSVLPTATKVNPDIKMSDRLRKSVTQAISSLDRRGAWVEKGTLHNYPDYKGDIIDSRTFVENIRILSHYLAATQD